MSTKTWVGGWVGSKLGALVAVIALSGCARGAPVSSTPLVEATPSVAAAPAVSATAPAPTRPQQDAKNAEASPALAQEHAEIPVSARDPQWGKRDALVTIVAFSDFESPFDAAAQPTLKRLRAAYGSDVLRLVWKNNPQPAHAAARPAALAAMVVFQLKGNDAFWRFHDRAFASPQSLDPSHFVRWAAEAGVEQAALFDAGNLQRATSKVDEDLSVALRRGAPGAPDFFVNGVVLRGAQPFEKFQQLIDQQIREASKLVANGTPKADVYALLTQTNRARRPGNGTLLATEANSIEASHLLVQYAGAMRAPATITRTKAEARQRVEEALAKAKQGVDFGQLAAEYSDEPRAAERRGALGTFRLGQMVKPFEQAAFALDVGELSEIVETDFGFHLIKRTR